MRHNDELDENFGSILSGRIPGSELVIGLVGAVGANLSNIVRDLFACLEEYNYTSQEIHVSDLIGTLVAIPDFDSNSDFERTNAFVAGVRPRAPTKTIKSLPDEHFLRPSSYVCE